MVGTEGLFTLREGAGAWLGSWKDEVCLEGSYYIIDYMSTEYILVTIYYQGNIMNRWVLTNEQNFKHK